MTRHLALSSIVSVAICAIIAAPLSAFADVTYTYTGNAFTRNPADTPPPSPGYDEVSGTITFAGALSPSTTYTSSDIVSYSFSDGAATLTNSNSTVITTVANFSLTTDSAGKIDAGDGWALEFGTYDMSGDPALEIVSWNDVSGLTYDIGELDAFEGASSPGGVILDDPGTWSAPSTVCITNCGSGTTPIPEPASFALMGVGVAGVAMARRRKKI